MTEKKEKPINYEQTPEEIRAILIEVADEKINIYERPHVDLIILSLKNEPDLISDLIVEKVEGDIAFMTYLCEDGGVGELIPLELFRIKKATIKN